MTKRRSSQTRKTERGRLPGSPPFLRHASERVASTTAIGPRPAFALAANDRSGNGAYRLLDAQEVLREAAVALRRWRRERADDAGTRGRAGRRRRGDAWSLEPGRPSRRVQVGLHGSSRETGTSLGASAVLRVCDANAAPGGEFFSRGARGGGSRVKKTGPIRICTAPG